MLKFGKADWVLCGKEYRLDIPAADFKVGDLAAYDVHVFEDGSTDEAEVEMKVTSKFVAMRLEAVPDIRFSGHLTVSKKK